MYRLIQMILMFPRYQMTQMCPTSRLHRKCQKTQRNQMYPLFRQNQMYPRYLRFLRCLMYHFVQKYPMSPSGRMFQTTP
jgi:hypothetical protein